MPRRRGLRPRLLAAVVRSDATLAFAAERQVVSLIGTMMRRRYLLDTNVPRNLACGERADELRRAKSLRVRLGHPPFATSELVVQEILAHIVPQEESAFPIFRSTLSILDMLVGNEGVCDRSDEVIRRILFITPHLKPKDDIFALNQLRRRLLKAESYHAIDFEDRRRCLVSAQLLDEARNDWIKFMESLKVKLILEKTDPTAGLPKQDSARVIKLVTEHMVSVLATFAQENQADNGGARSREEIEHDLREFIYFEAALIQKAMNKGSYNFVRNRNDHFDQLLCSYAGLGYVLVTEDRRIIEMLRGVDCPRPRLVGFSDALTELEQSSDGTG